MSKTKVITGKVRGSYVNIFKARLNKESKKEEFSLAIIIQKTDTATIERILAAEKEAILAKWGSQPPAGLKRPLRDADKEAEANGVTVDPAYAGCYFMNAKSYEPIQIVDASNPPQAVFNQFDFTSGDYCRISANASAYDKPMNKGVSFWLNSLQVLGKGEPLGNTSRAEDDFADEYQDEGDRGGDLPFG